MSNDLLTDLQLESLLIHVLTPAGNDKVRVLATGVTLPSHGGGITNSGDDSTTNAWLACQPLDGVASLALQSDICCLVLQQMPFCFGRDVGDALRDIAAQIQSAPAG